MADERHRSEMIALLGLGIFLLVGPSAGGGRNTDAASTYRITHWSDLYRVLETTLHISVVGIPHEFRGGIRISGTREQVLTYSTSLTGLTVRMVGGGIAVFAKNAIVDKEVNQWIDHRLQNRLREAKAIAAFLNATEPALRARLESELFLPLSLLSDQQLRLAAAAHIGHPLEECPANEVDTFLQRWRQIQDPIVSVAFYPVVYVVNEQGESMMDTPEPAFPEEWQEMERLPWSETIKRWRTEYGKIILGSLDQTPSASWQQKVQEVDAVVRQIATKRREENLSLCERIGAKVQVRISQSILPLSEVLQRVRDISHVEIIADRRLARQEIYVSPGSYPAPLLLRSVCQALGLSVRPVGGIFFFTSSPGTPLTPQQKLQLRTMALKAKADYWRVHFGFLFPSDELFRHLDPVWSKETLLNGACLPWSELTERQRGFLFRRFPNLVDQDLSRASVVVAPGVLWYWRGVTGVATDNTGRPLISQATGKPIIQYMSSARLIY